eukprot:jgi/Chlat1/2136/Chrsp17S02726
MLLRRGAAGALRPRCWWHAGGGDGRGSLALCRAFSSEGGTGGGGEDGDDESKSGGGKKLGGHEISDDSSITARLINALIPQSAPKIDKYRKVLAVPLIRRPLMPHSHINPVFIQDAKLYTRAQELFKEGHPYVGAFLKRPEDQLDAGDPAGHLFRVGTFSQVIGFQHIKESTEVGTMLLLGRQRILRTTVEGEDPLTVGIEHIKDSPIAPSDDVIRATRVEIISTLRDLIRMNPLYKEHLTHYFSVMGDFNFENPSHVADFIPTLTTADGNALQEILETREVPDRLVKTLLLLKKEVEIVRLQAEVGRKVEEKITGDQRRFFLMEQLKSIKKELGMERDDKTALVDKFRERLESFRGDASEEVVKVIEEELQKLSGLEGTSSEFNVTRNYLDWLTALPWGKFTPENYDLVHAQKVLDEDHYGLSDVKERILEFIAVGHLRGNTQGKIICLSGPPGVGKTSIGKSIARALDRKFYRFSVGGLSDVAEIKGHRRTYVGAMPGKLVQALKAIGTSNPVVMIDEIDKLGRGYQGDPASALLELLDPEQNASFLDHYLDVPVDLSKVLFICTANVVEAIPGPLLDRMEVIRLAGYIAEEKLAIARDYLEPQAKERSGVEKDKAVVTESALKRLIDEYCREAGVRNLSKQLERIYRKVALKLVRSGDAKEATLVAIEESDLQQYVGSPTFTSEKFYKQTPVGVVMGLAWTSMGGMTLYVETTVEDKAEGRGSLRTTGQLGDVMKESATIAYTVARQYYTRIVQQQTAQRTLLQAQPAGAPAGATQEFATAAAPGPALPAANFFSTNTLHMHVPAGATPKDGPSAGCTMITSILSLALGKPVRPNLAMTGEVTLTGAVLPIGGVREKTVAARRSGVKTLIFPSGNQRDYEELPDYLKTDLDVHFVEHYDQIYKLTFDWEEEPAVETDLR